MDVLEAISANPGIAPTRLGQEVNVPYSRLTGYLRLLREKGFIYEGEKGGLYLSEEGFRYPNGDAEVQGDFLLLGTHALI